MIHIYQHAEDGVLLFANRQRRRAYYEDESTPPSKAFEVSTGTFGRPYRSDAELFSEGSHIFIGKFRTFDEFVSVHPEFLI